LSNNKEAANENEKAEAGDDKAVAEPGKAPQVSAVTSADTTSASKDNSPAAEGSRKESSTSAATANGDKKASAKKDKAAGKRDSKTKTPGDKTSSGIHIPWLALLILVFTGAVGYGVYYDYQLLQQIQQTNQSQTANHEALEQEVSRLRDNLNQTEAHNQQLLDQLSASAQERQSIEQSINALSEQLAKQGRGPRQWRVAEVDYLLNIANQRLILQRDVKTAVHALSDADARLESIADPALIPVRKDIASEISALRVVQLPDIDGMAVTLQGLVDNIEQLPLISKEHVIKREQKVESAKNWRDLPGALWNDIKSLVIIRRGQPKVERLLPPEEIHYLYQNLGLKLEQARIALLQQDSSLFKRNLADTETWIKRYFDPEATAVSSVLSTITQLSAVELQPKLPDISASLRTLRQWTASQTSHVAPASPQSRHVARKVPQVKPETQTTAVKQ